MPYYRYTPPRVLSGNYVDQRFNPPYSSLPDPTNKIVNLPVGVGGYSAVSQWRVPPYFGGLGSDLVDQVTSFVSQYGLYIGGAILAYSVLASGTKRRRNPARRRHYRARHRR
jgi:hypothetical protein